jgi:hypothetical protein
MNFKTSDWLKKITTAYAAKPTQSFPSSANPAQRFTGQVGGNQTTAQQTQPLSAQLGGQFSPQQRQSMEALTSWIYSQFPDAMKSLFTPSRGWAPSLNQGWIPSLPQNITNTALRRKGGMGWI